jgi:hypothetical protein
MGIGLMDLTSFKHGVMIQKDTLKLRTLQKEFWIISSNVKEDDMGLASISTLKFLPKRFRLQKN